MPGGNLRRAAKRNGCIRRLFIICSPSLFFNEYPPEAERSAIFTQVWSQEGERPDFLYAWAEYYLQPNTVGQHYAWVDHCLKAVICRSRGGLSANEKDEEFASNDKTKHFCGRQEEPAILKVVITHALHVCSQYSFGLPLRMDRMHRTQFDHARLDLLPTYNLITHVLTICHVKRMQSTVLEQKRFGLRSLSLAFRNLWLLLVVLQSTFGRKIGCFVCSQEVQKLNEGNKSGLQYCFGFCLLQTLSSK